MTEDIITKIKKINSTYIKNITRVITYNNEILKIEYRKNVNNGTFKCLAYNDLIKDKIKEIKYDISYINMTNEWAKNSYAKRKKVGALFVKDTMIISDGFNGTPAHFSNECEDDNDITYPYVCHAEQNALSKLAKSTNSAYKSTLYVSMSPCQDCSKQVIQAGTKRIVFWEFYRKDSAVDWMLKSNMKVDYYNSKIISYI